MAEAPKKGAASLYGKPPRIEEDKGEGDTPRNAGAPDKAREKAADTAGKPESDSKVEGDMKSGTEAKGDVMAGTDGIPTSHHMQHAEREALHHKHMMEHVHMHSRHQQDHTMRAMGHHHEDMHTMDERHHGERRKLHTNHERELREMHQRHEEMGEGDSGPTGGMKEKEVGNAGTEK